MEDKDPVEVIRDQTLRKQSDTAKRLLPAVLTVIQGCLADLCHDGANAKEVLRHVVGKPGEQEQVCIFLLKAGDCDVTQAVDQPGVNQCNFTRYVRFEGEWKDYKDVRRDSDVAIMFYDIYVVRGGRGNGGSSDFTFLPKKDMEEAKRAYAGNVGDWVRVRFFFFGKIENGVFRRDDDTRVGREDEDAETRTPCRVLVACKHRSAPFRADEVEGPQLPMQSPSGVLPPPPPPIPGQGPPGGEGAAGGGDGGGPAEDSGGDAGLLTADPAGSAASSLGLLHSDDGLPIVPPPPLAAGAALLPLRGPAYDGREPDRSGFISGLQGGTEEFHLQFDGSGLAAGSGVTSLENPLGREGSPWMGAHAHLGQHGHPHMVLGGHLVQPADHSPHSMEGGRQLEGGGNSPSDTGTGTRGFPAFALGFSSSYPDAHRDHEGGELLEGQEKNEDSLEPDVLRSDGDAESGLGR
uniref:Uncharacterized protein n=1 Tax=Chromera velia CCMP2878 TaxID=1169474 RepID=A0A0G4FJU7_9ALVE|eukprot:Cvel_3385.t1-p1 / transcript=Cvel_3385.t1 / gene=Cvel_3385 / organism=Chromera_velia_CCMP2878 / gene_product=hypothetical protein / transcript_product=hypothetical protein / location=Cvel_scaffold136:58858-62329(-) / protein_length=462 / sequence_SO=supercontig / SO=protein_coding / is_pseudo=false